MIPACWLIIVPETLNRPSPTFPTYSTLENPEMASIKLPSSYEGIDAFSHIPTAKLDGMALAAVEAKQIAYCKSDSV